jgi:hypothetical protein
MLQTIVTSVSSRHWREGGFLWLENSNANKNLEGSETAACGRRRGSEHCRLHVDQGELARSAGGELMRTFMQPGGRACPF